MSAAFIPDSEAIRTVFADTSEVKGEIISLSDSGMAFGVFAVVEVTRKQTVVVPVEKLRLSGS
jgi:hypothetical protein